MFADMSAIVNKVGMLFGRGRVSLVDDGKKMQSVQVEAMAGETLEDVEHPQPYGFSSSPIPGAEAFMAFVGGDRSHGIALVVDDRRYRIKALGQGEVAIYSHEGHSVKLRNGRAVEIDCDDLTINAANSVSVNTAQYAVNATQYTVTASQVSFQSASVTASGVMSVTGELTALAGSSALSMSDIRTQYNQHSHQIDGQNPNFTKGPRGGLL